MDCILFIRFYFTGMLSRVSLSDCGGPALAAGDDAALGLLGC